MSSIETSDLLQDAVLWEPVGIDEYSRPLLGAPVPIKVRWNEENTVSTDKETDKEDTGDEVFVDRDIPLNSVLWKGKLDDLPAEPSPLKQVFKFTKIGDIKNRHFRRTVRLLNYTDSLPNPMG